MAEPDVAADSARFAEYWALLESGQGDSAREFLFGLGETDTGDLAGLANFVLARVNYEDENFASIPVLLDLGVPAELADHAWALRARALTAAGQPSLAASYWQRVLDLDGSVVGLEAATALADYYRSLGRLDSALAAIQRVIGAAPAAERRQLQLTAAELLAARDRHADAVDTLWTVYSQAPRSAEGRHASGAIEAYSATHGFIPRRQRGDELRQELSALEAENAFETGLNRVREISAPGSDANPELVSFYRARFTAGLKRHRDAVPLLDDFVTSYPRSEFRARALVQLGRSAYLLDRDSLAIAAFATLAGCGDDSASICAGLRLLNDLHMDRGQPLLAVRACERWGEFAAAASERADALWRLGWAWWEARDFARAAQAWAELATATTPDSEYAPASLYWEARARLAAGDVPRAHELLDRLTARFPYSYYTVMLSRAGAPPESEPTPLAAPTLQQLWDSGGPHARAFALLVAMRDVDAALLELPVAMTECGDESSWQWWKAQLYLWLGDRMTAWRITRANLGEYIRGAGWRPPQFYRVVYPLDFDPTVLDLSRRHAVDPYFIFGLICQESHYAEQIVSSAGAIGLMQLMPATARAQAKRLGVAFSPDRLYDGDYNLRIGIAHVADLWSEFAGDSLLVLAAYNAGKSAAQMWYEEFGDRDRDVFVEKIPYRETRLFVKRIVEHIAAYRRLYPDLLNPEYGGADVAAPRP